MKNTTTSKPIGRVKALRHSMVFHLHLSKALFDCQAPQELTQWIELLGMGNVTEIRRQAKNQAIAFCSWITWLQSG